MATEIGEVVGYARVSTDDQDLTMQIQALVSSGIPRERIFAEKVSGAARRLPERAKALKMASRSGWTLRVWKLDRLGRSMRDVVTIADEIKRAGGYIQTMDGVDTRNPIVGALLLQMLAIVAEFERSMIAARTKAGMAARKAKGATFGAPRKIVGAKLRDIKRELGARDRSGRLLYTVEEIAARHEVSPSTINGHPDLRAYRTKLLGATRRGRPRNIKT